VAAAAPAVHPAPNGGPHVDPRVLAALLAIPGAGFTCGLIFVSAGGRGEQRPLLHSVRRQPGPVRVRA
jgi:hypothetical protein